MNNKTAKIHRQKICTHSQRNSLATARQRRVEHQFEKFKNGAGNIHTGDSYMTSDSNTRIDTGFDTATEMSLIPSKKS